MKKDKRLIPYGYYCYSAKGKCPYWSIRNSKPKQRNGYCAYLKKGDWNINAERIWNVSKKVNEKWKLIKRGTADELGLIGSLLWDQVKECGIKVGITKTGPSSIAEEISIENKKGKKK